MSGPFDPYHEWLGIPPAEQPPHHYRLLGIAVFEDSPNVIENAADQRMVHLRSFQAGRQGPLSQKLLNEVAAARLCLLRPEKKAAYDAQLRERIESQTSPEQDADDRLAAQLAEVLSEARAPAAKVHAPATPPVRKTNLAIWLGVGAAAPLLLLLVLSLCGRGQLPPKGLPPKSPPLAPLRLQPIALQTIEAGKTLTFFLAAENIESAAGKWQFDPQCRIPAGASLDERTGRFTWTPTPQQAGGKYEIAVVVRAADKRTDHGTFTITVAPTHVAPSEKRVPIDLGQGVKLELTLIPAGEFMMGSPDSDSGAAPHERPQHRVRITKPFYLGVYEVTIAQFQRFAEEASYKTAVERGDTPGAHGWVPAEGKLVLKPDFSWRKPGFEQASDHPVVNVAWDDAQAFCEWLGKKNGATFRLPTEAEWEYVCRAGTSTLYYNGDDAENLAQVGNVSDKTLEATIIKDRETKKGRPPPAIQGKDGFAFTAPVGQKERNAFGLYDMHGNVLEWCADWFAKDYYGQSPMDDPPGPDMGPGKNPPHVSRGGCFHVAPRGCRSAARWNTNEPWSTVGFRVVREVGKPLGGAIPPPSGPSTTPTSQAPPGSGTATQPTSPPEAASTGSGSATSGGSISAVVGGFDPTRAARAAEIAEKARHEQETCAKHLLAPVEMTNAIGMKLRLIPSGEFDMGSTREETAWATEEATRNDDKGSLERIPGESPRHRVRISRAFYLGVYEVTQAEYQQVMGNNPSHFSAQGKGAAEVAGQDTARHPVESVSWNDAAQFCQKLAAVPEEVASRRAYRLPTEAEWEYACRAGSATKWSCGDEIAIARGYAWWLVNSGKRTHEVGGKKPNAWGLYDMHGNVSEWCLDWYATDYYLQSPGVDPTGPAAGSERVMRGGHIGFYITICRSASRTKCHPQRRVGTLGFRVVCEVGKRSLNNIPPSAPPTSLEAPQGSGTATKSTGPPGGAPLPGPLPPPQRAGPERSALFATLYAQYADLAVKFKPSDDKCRKLRTEYQRVAAKAAPWEQQVTRCEAALVNLNKQLTNVTLTNPLFMEDVKAQITATQNRLSLARAELAPYAASMENLNGQLLRLQQEAAPDLARRDKLTQQWCALCDPLGVLGRQSWEAMDRQMTGWILERQSMSQLYLARGFARLHLKNREGAFADFDQVDLLCQSPDVLADTAAARGYLLYVSGDKVKAGTLFAEAARKYPTRVMIYLLRGQAHLRCGEWNLARPEFETAVKHNKNTGVGCPEPYAALARLLASCPLKSLRNTKLALDHATQADQLQIVDKWFYLDTLGMAHAEAGDFDAAVKCADGALETAPAENQLDIRQRKSLYEKREAYRAATKKR